MPVKACTIDGNPGFRWGDAGKCYAYEEGNADSEAAARASAARQGAAAHASGYTGATKAHAKQSTKGVIKMDLINQEVLLNKHIIRIEDTPEGIQVLYAASHEDARPTEDAKKSEDVRSDADVDIDILFPIAKVDERRLITGIVLEPGIVDAHKDFETAQTIEDAAHNFLRKYNQQTRMGLQHTMFGAIGVDLVESYLAPQDFDMGGEGVRKGSWVITVKVHDDGLWDRIKKGEITGFSIGGSAKSRPSQPTPN